MLREQDPTFAELLSELMQGSNHALEELICISESYLLKIASSELESTLGAKVGASDLAQTTHLKAKQKFDAFNGHSRAELFGWLRSILLNELRSNRRKLGREINVKPHLERPLNGRSPSSIAIQDENVEAVQKALHNLPDHYSRLIRLRDFEKKKFAEIAEITGQSIRAAAKCYWRAIERLRQKLESRDDAR